MDWVTWKQGGSSNLRKYGCAVLILAVGIFLMVLPQGKAPEQTAEVPEPEPDLQQSLTQILSSVEGAGKVEVLLTEAAGARTLYQSDETRSETDLRSTTVLVTGRDREETGLVRQILPPKYQGAVVVCQGAGDSRVKLAIVEAVMSATGLTSDKITVLKMK